MTRQLVHYNRTASAVTPGGVYRELRTTWHLHFCADRDCRLVYECGPGDCPDVSKNERCRLCRGLRRPIWVAARDPQECCIGNCLQVASPDELLRYRLAGPGPWFQCKSCARCHGWPCN